VNKSKTNNEGAPIMLRITMNGEQASMNVRRRIPLEDWDSKCFMPKVYNAFTDDLYVFLETLRSKAFQAFTELTKDYDEVTPAGDSGDVDHPKPVQADQGIPVLGGQYGRNFHSWADSSKTFGYSNSYKVFNEYMTWSLFSLYCIDNYEIGEVEKMLLIMEDQMVNDRGFIKFREFNRKLIKSYEETKDIYSLYQTALINE
jgi:hypothetical protein